MPLTEHCVLMLAMYSEVTWLQIKYSSYPEVVFQYLDELMNKKTPKKKIGLRFRKLKNFSQITQAVQNRTWNFITCDYIWSARENNTLIS